MVDLAKDNAATEMDHKLVVQVAVALWIAQSGKDRPEDAEERRADWIAKKGEYMPLARRTLRVLRLRGVQVELGSAKDVD